MRHGWQSRQIGLPVVFDTGGVLALSRLDRRVRAIVAAALRERSQIWVPAAVVVELVRGGGPRDAPLNRALGDVCPLGEVTVRDAGKLLARGGGAVDAIVVATALKVASPAGATVVTSDPNDISALAEDYPQIRVAPV